MFGELIIGYCLVFGIWCLVISVLYPFDLVENCLDEAIHIEPLHTVEVIRFSGASISGDPHLVKTSGQTMLGDDIGDEASQTRLDMVIFVGDHSSGIGRFQDCIDIQIA